MICVYSITNKINNKRYIGQTVNSHKRKIDHFTRLKTGKHHSIKLQNSFNKHGIVNFSFDILLECDLNEINDLEKYYIWLYDSYKNGYNHNLGSNDRSNFGVKFIYQGKEYTNIKEMANKLGIDYKGFYAKIKYGRKDRSWNYKACEWNGIKYNSISAAAKANNISEAAMKARIDKGKKSDKDVKYSTLKTNITIRNKTYESLSIAAKDLNIPSSTLCRWVKLNRVEEFLNKRNI